jgi:hypothetical protein
MRNAGFLSCNQQVNNTIVNGLHERNSSEFPRIPSNYKPLVNHDYGAMDGLKCIISFAFIPNCEFEKTAPIWK